MFFKNVDLNSKSLTSIPEVELPQQHNSSQLLGGSGAESCKGGCGYTWKESDSLADEGMSLSRR